METTVRSPFSSPFNMHGCMHFTYLGHSCVTAIVSRSDVCSEKGSNKFTYLSTVRFYAQLRFSFHLYSVIYCHCIQTWQWWWKEVFGVSYQCRIFGMVYFIIDNGHCTVRSYFKVRYDWTIWWIVLPCTKLYFVLERRASELFRRHSDTPACFGL